MMESATSLSTTGMIAAILAVVFAFAAFFAQHSRRTTREALHRKMKPVRPASETMRPETGPSAQSATERIPAPAPADDTALFKIYTIGETGAKPETDDPERALWE